MRSNYQVKWTGDTLTGFTITPFPHFCACPNQDLDFQHYMSKSSFSMFIDFRCGVIVRCVDLGGIVYYHCFNFLIINLWNQKNNSCNIKPLTILKLNFDNHPWNWWILADILFVTKHFRKQKNNSCDMVYNWISRYRYLNSNFW